MANNKNIERKCKWCDSPPKKWYDKNGRFKCYQKTCGSEKCLTAMYRDNGINARKKWNNTKKCEKCETEYLSLSRSQKWCKKCVPTKSARAIMSRYGISNNEYLLINSENKNCPICLREMKNPCIDHNHETGKVRGIICSHCNTSLNVIEDEQKLKRALMYLKNADLKKEIQLITNN